MNLALRFFLELLGLSALAWFGWSSGRGVFKYALAAALPIGAAFLWGTLAVRGDPSRSGNAPIPVPGILRLVVELAFFGAATWSLHATGATKLALGYGLTVLVHYAVSHDRVLWLLRQ